MPQRIKAVSKVNLIECLLSANKQRYDKNEKQLSAYYVSVLMFCLFCLCNITEMGALDSLPPSVTSDELANP